MSSRPCTVTGCPNTTKRGSGRCSDHRYADRDARLPVPPPAGTSERAATAEAALRAEFGDAARITATTFVSGAVDLQVQHGTGFAVVQSGPDATGWGVSVDPDEPDGPTGHDHVVGSVEDVVRLLRNRWPAG